MDRFRTYRMLCRPGIALFAAGAAVTGYRVAGGTSMAAFSWLSVAVFVLANGASALNQYQERDIDALMERTRRRPLPSGSLPPRAALLIAAILVVAGLLALFVLGTAALILGACALLWYNGLYTPLKRRTAFAAVIGSFVGAVPAVIGWTAAGGDVRDPRLLALAMFFLLWQVPHFWLLLLRRETEYRAAGLPAVTGLFGAAALGRITLLWTIAAATVPILLPIFGVVRSPLIAWSLFPLLVLTAAVAVLSLRHPGSPAAFRWINAFLAIVMVLLSIDPLLRRTG